MISKDQLNKFDQIEDLPISEEMLGAYLEGNLSPSELFDVESAIQENDYLSELTNTELKYEVDLDISNEIASEDFDLPLISNDSFIELDLAYSSSFPVDYIATCAVEDHYSQDNSYNDDSIDNPFEDDDTSFDSSDDNDISDYE